MKGSPWLLGSVVIVVLGGVVFFLMGWLQPGKITNPENQGATGKSLLAEAKKKTEEVRQAGKALWQDSQQFAGMKGKEGEHRVFVSAQLVYDPNDAEPVQPLDRKMTKGDGIEIGWKMRYGFDPADPGIKDEDPDGDGFTNLEEFTAKTDPTKKEDSPAKESKLKSRAGEPLAMVVSFPEKSGGFYTVRFQVGAKRKEFKGKPGDVFWVMAGPENLELFQDEGKVATARAKAKEAGQNHHVIPVEFLSYQEKIEKIKDLKAGGVEVEVDNSEIVLQRKDGISELQKLAFASAQQPRALQWDVGEIRFYTPAGGGTEIGPFRLGETFLFEGKEFTLVGREGKKIELVNRKEPEKKSFWVPPDTLQATDSSKP